MSQSIEFLGVKKEQTWKMCRNRIWKGGDILGAGDSFGSWVVEVKQNLKLSGVLMNYLTIYFLFVYSVLCFFSPPFLSSFGLLLCSFCMKCSLGICNFLEEISILSHFIVFLYLFALIIEEAFLIAPCLSLKLCIQMGISFVFYFAFSFSSFHSCL